ncbi:ATP-binding protein [Streptomyces sp. NBC_01808]|uniref:ATP-binding protein n=1 Tax=Streptomyces sp. NBC_01808 TaxID=2975947 RepID=UPI002DD83B7D|nr:ATP-binding protein [Streptomyces sp. NBC_01808]WSA41257.1 ATP-binding protein [Streptomyces sp. NBC_01808]
MTLYGRDAVLRELVPRMVGLHHTKRKAVRQEPRGEVPTVLLHGGHGSGRTAVLDALREAYADRVPVAAVDCAGVRDDDAAVSHTSPVAELLTGLARGLSAHCPGFGRLRLPRLLTGLVAVSAWHRGELDEQACARERVEALLTDCGLEKNPERARNWPGDVLDRIGGWGTDELGPVAAASVQLFTDRYLGFRENRAVRQWYEGLADVPTSQQDDNHVLTALCRAFHLGEGMRRRIEVHLVEALLEDLRAAYTGWRHLNAAPRPLALLDNVHTAAGTELLDLLLARRVTAAERPDPLVVVAATLGEPRGDRYAGAARWTAANVPGLREWRRGGEPGDPAAGLVTLLLPPLDSDELLSMMHVGEERAVRQEVARAVHRFTGGSPLGCRIFYDALDAAPEPAAVEPHELTRLRLAGEHVTELMLAALVPDAGLSSYLVLLSVAQDAAAARALAAAYLTRDHQAGAVEEARSHLRDERWPQPGRPFVGDDFLRAVLVDELRRRPADATDPPQPWPELHELLQRHHEDRGEHATARHHELAAGRSAEPARWLAETLHGPATDRWLTDLWHIARAPHPPDPAWADVCRATASGERDGTLAGADSVARSVNRLLHAVWYAADPLSVPDAHLRGRIGRELDFLSFEHPTGGRALYAASQDWPAALKEPRTPDSAVERREGGEEGRGHAIP